MKLFKSLLISGNICLMFAQPVLAHTQWLLPNVFNTSLNDKSVWMSGQLSVSEAVFTPERGFVAQQLAITTPDGKQQLIKDVFTGHTASVFDYEIRQAGTYKVEALSGPKIRQRKTPPKPGAKAYPKTKVVSRLTAYITADSPNTNALKPSNSWLEIIPVTHPADLVAQELATFKVLYNGDAFTNETVTLVASGSEYRNQNLNKKYTTDENGVVKIVLGTAGVYLLTARFSEALADDPQAEQLRVKAGLTFEAQVN